MVPKIKFWLGYALPVALFAAFVLLAPLDVMQQFPTLQRLADRVHALLLHAPLHPDIFIHARSTRFPQVAQAASALAVVVTLYIALFSATSMGLNRKEALASLRLSSPSFRDRLALPMVAPAGLFLMWAFFCLPGDPSFGHGLTATSRSGYTLLASISILMSGVGLGGLYLSLLSLGELMTSRPGKA
jgi:hypothetical protein